MEPIDFDRIVKQKLEGENHLHNQQVTDSKPYVWAAIQQGKSNRAAGVPWLYAAATILIIFLCSVFLLFQQKEKSNLQLEQLTAKIETLQQNYRVIPTTVTAEKNGQIDLLCSEIDQLEKNLGRLKNQQMAAPTALTTLVYKTDTVYINKVEYVTQYINPTNEEEKELEKPKAPPESLPETTDIIFPDFSKPTRNSQKETASVKLKLASFEAN